MIAASHAQMYNVMLQILGVLQSSIRILLIRNGVDAIQAVMLQVLAVFFYFFSINKQIGGNRVITNQGILHILLT